MFQYAMGRSLSRRLGRSLVLDASMMPSGHRPHLRSLSIRDLPISPRVRVIGASRHFSQKPLRKRPIVGLAGRILTRCVNPWSIEEADPEAEVPLSDVPQRIAHLRGYWQSPHYFADIPEIIRSELFPPMPNVAGLTKVMALLTNREAIAVHVRRGDYVAVTSVQQVHGVLGATYYQSAVDQIVLAVESDPVVLVLSDDPLWAEESLRFDVETVHVEIEAPLTDIESLALMARCRHHVISNSSFSWWGAWLAEHDTQQVIYPARWFKNTSIAANFRFPSHWSSLPLTD